MSVQGEEGRQAGEEDGEVTDGIRGSRMFSNILFGIILQN